MLDQLITNCRQIFCDRFGREPTHVVAAPGRVNLIGEHIDYNDGFVLPMAIERYVVIAADLVRTANPSAATAYSRQLDKTARLQLGEFVSPDTDRGWENYLQGVVAGFQSLGYSIPTFEAVIDSNIPLGGGLSSSAALEVATATLLESLTGKTIGPEKKAILCQSAEQQYAGVPCGIMDQFSSVFGKPDQLMLINCQSQEIESVPFGASDVLVLITNSNVKHELTGSEYAQRRSECDTALQKLSANSWRDLSRKELVPGPTNMSETEFKRARHVITEIERTRLAAEAFAASQWNAAGELMYASHDSLRDDFEVSCQELDVLVELARQIGPTGGMIGSRMTGGGFGGCTVSLVKAGKVETVISSLTTNYESQFGFPPTCFTSRPALGAHVVT